MDDLEKKVAEFAKNTEKKMMNVAREAVEAVIREAETPVAKGGKMRVDTGFLRSSGVAGVNEMPMGKTEGRQRANGEVGEIYTGRINGDNLQTSLARWNLGETFFYGWTARYGKYREAYDGFLESALQNWPQTVSIAIKTFRKE